MTNVLTAEQLLSNAPAPDTKTIEVPEFGGEVRVKGLTRADIVRIRKVATAAGRGQADEATFDREVFLAGVVEPKFTAEAFDQLSSTALATPIARVLNTILELSGAGEGATREAEATFPAGQ